MRRIVLVLVVVAMALALAGCGGGGGGGEAAAPQTPAPAAAPPVAPAAPAAIGSIGDRSANASPTFEPFPQGDFVPQGLKAGIDAKRPTIILFHDGSYTSKTTREIIDVVRGENRGTIDLVVFDLGRSVTTSPEGIISAEPTLTSDPAASQPVLLARALGVTAVPFTVITDSQGYVIWKYRGLVEKAFLEREVRRAAP